MGKLQLLWKLRLRNLHSDLPALWLEEKKKLAGVLGGRAPSAFN